MPRFSLALAALAGTLIAAPVALGATTITTPTRDQVIITGDGIDVAAASDGACVKFGLTPRISSTEVASVHIPVLGGNAVGLLPLSGLIADDAYRVEATGYANANCTGSEAGSASVNVTVDRFGPHPFALDEQQMPLTTCPDGLGRCVLAKPGSVLIDWKGTNADIALLAGYQVRIGGVERFAGPTSITKATLDISPTEPAYQSLEVIASDTRGRTTTATPDVRLALDATAPSVSWAAPTKVYVGGKSLPLAFTVSDAAGPLSSGIKTVYLGSKAVDANLVPKSDLGRLGPGETTTRLDTSVFADGRYEWVAVAEDVAGNRTSATKTVVIDNTAPRFLTKPQRRVTVRRGNRVTLTVRVTDALSKRVTVQYIVRQKRKNVFSSKPVSRPNGVTQRLVLPAKVTRRSGTYTVTVKATDQAGRYRTIGSVVRVMAG